MKTKNKALPPLISALDDLIAAAKSAKLHETAGLMRIARLDLLMRVHGIRPDELEFLTFAMEKAGLQTKPSSAKSRKNARPRLN